MAEARDRVREWLAELGIAKQDAEDLVLACSEACANVVEHTTTERGPNALVLRGRVLLDSVVRLTVRDFGRWRFFVKTPERGRGLELIRRLADQVSILRHADGTEVTLYRRLDLSRPPPSPRSRPKLAKETATGPATADSGGVRSR